MESCWENLCNEIQLKGPHGQKQTQEQSKKEWQAGSVYVRHKPWHPHHVKVSPRGLINEALYKTKILTFLMFCFDHFCARDNSYLFSRCFEPIQPRRITSGLNTNFTLSPSYSFHKSSHHKLWGFFFVVVVVLIFSLFIFREHSTREPASGRVTYFILRAYILTMC